MAATQHFSITLPQEMAEVVEQKIRSGAYTSASDVIHDSVEALIERDERDERFEQWLREEVVPGHAQYLADPTTGVPAEAILDRIIARRTTRNSPDVA